MPEWICPYKNGTLLKLAIVPGARRSEVAGFHGGRLKIRIAAPPQDGEANAELISFLSEILKLPKKNIEIVRGETSRSKDVFVDLPGEKMVTLLKPLP